MSKEEETIEHLDSPKTKIYCGNLPWLENTEEWKTLGDSFTTRLPYPLKVQNPRPKFGCTAPFAYFKIKLTEFWETVRQRYRQR